MTEIPEAIRRAIAAQEKATKGRVTVAAVEEALAENPIPTDAEAVAEQQQDWRAQLQDEPADLSEREQEMIQEQLPGADE